MKKRWQSIVAVALSSVVAVAAFAPRSNSAQFQTVFAGVSPDGQGNVWEGHADGVVPGRVRLELRQVAPPIEAANPIWHVRGQWTLGAGDAQPVVADVEGVVDWKAGLIRVGGPIASGQMSGAWLAQEGRVVDGDISGSITIVR